ncbi:unnamed protein product [Linum tenue]|uniref:Uncharacterized protein n=1 Tax=Linum tenue TaxID=586396 RepID=A0AAV0MKI7_9ROSI|nr:unnamed protein product [Linum tenue]
MNPIFLISLSLSSKLISPLSLQREDPGDRKVGLTESIHFLNDSHYRSEEQFT